MTSESLGVEHSDLKEIQESLLEMAFSAGRELIRSHDADQVNLLIKDNGELAARGAEPAIAAHESFRLYCEALGESQYGGEEIEAAASDLVGVAVGRIILSEIDKKAARYLNNTQPFSKRPNWQKTQRLGHYQLRKNLVDTRNPACRQMYGLEFSRAVSREEVFLKRTRAED